ncbi:SDR family NAD(P)-dependent oxidoreductase [Kallotenue papyrolyticum]|uniref:SDR family NAD(P)-dependent oxidoreductase n=1 Tax=Kallotenue papyrolyticum TaxID=1325125 RepID=UPI0004929A5B|nr:SDR family NAD(P)-dependent oxidoreductase [Kallotenue papyrolyticum]
MERVPWQDRVVLITGASSGIGQATALRCRGARLFVVGRDPQRLQQVAIASGATPIQADLLQPVAAAAIAEAVRQAAGRLDVLINCAGQLELGPAAQLGAATLERLIAINLLGAVRLIDACLPLLRAAPQPVIINVGSLAGLIAPPYMAAYAASKFALTGYTRALRQELCSQGIHVGLVLPGPVATPMVAGRLGGPYYPLPPATPVVTADAVARAILRAVTQRRAEVFVPRRLGPLARLAAAAPGLVDWLYRRLHATARAAAGDAAAPDR